jgi:hypothetical protein
MVIPCIVQALALALAFYLSISSDLHVKSHRFLMNSALLKSKTCLQSAKSTLNIVFELLLCLSHTKYKPYQPLCVAYQISSPDFFLIYLYKHDYLSSK